MAKLAQRNGKQLTAQGKKHEYSIEKKRKTEWWENDKY